MTIEKKRLTPRPEADNEILTDTSLASTSPYASQRKADTPARGSNGKTKAPKAKDATADLRKQLAASARTIASLKEEEKARKEATPTLRISDDSFALVFKGVIAGKKAERQELLFTHEQAKLLQPLIYPIIAVMNAALRQQRLEPIPRKTEEGKLAKYDKKIVYKAGPLVRASIAYEAILNSPEVCEKLIELNAAIEKAYANIGCHPKDVRNVVKRSAQERGNQTVGFEVVDDPAATDGDDFI